MCLDDGPNTDATTGPNYDPNYYLWVMLLPFDRATVEA